jgi:hypothetical protein
MTSDDVIFDKLRRSLKGNTPKTGIRGNWFTGGECVRLLELLAGASARLGPEPPPPAPVATVSLGPGPALTVQVSGAWQFQPGQTLEVHPAKPRPE